MKDFVKIFLGICALVAAFVFGRSYGEKGFKESEEYRSFVKANEDLSFSKNELENVKAKLQNITDAAENKKTDELLAEILHVFLTDLGLRLQNKDAILKQAQQVATTTEHAVFDKNKLKAESPAATQTNTEAKSDEEEKRLREELAALKAQKKWTSLELGKYKSAEWILQNSSSNNQIKEQLKKVKIKNMNSFLNTTVGGDEAYIGAFLGDYSGNIDYINGKRFGTLGMKFSKIANGSARLGVEISLLTQDGKGDATKMITQGGFGSRQPELDGIVTKWQDSYYFQFYKVKNPEQIAGIYYQSLPNGATNEIGSFILKKRR